MSSEPSERLDAYVPNQEGSDRALELDDPNTRDQPLRQRSPPRADTSNTNCFPSQDIIARPSSDVNHVRFSVEHVGSSNRDQSSIGQTQQTHGRIRITPEAPRNETAAQPTRVSSRSRDRGYSLRRSLFTQNVNKQNRDHGIAMELEQPSSSQKASIPDKSSKGPAVIATEEAQRHASLTTAPSTSASGSGARQWSRWTTKPRKQKSRLSRVFDALRVLFERAIGPVELPPTADGRHVQVNVRGGPAPNDERTGKPYVTNLIRSCKYTLWNFFPKQLVAQFGKLANFYFLIVSILQMLPGLSTTGTYTTIIPLMIFVGISMAKEGYEDVRRNRLDKEENERKTCVLNGTALSLEPKSSSNEEDTRINATAWSETKWKELKVGDVVLLKRDDPVPADIILLHSSGPEGATYIETKGLDGETNLKTKKPLELISSRCAGEAAIARLEADFVVEDPNLDLYKFDGRVSVAGQTLPLTSGEVIYRGSTVRNTTAAIGIIIFSGEECKIRMNANKNPRIKAPTLQAKVNRVVIFVACLVLFIAIILSIGYIIWKRTTENDSWYLDEADVPFGKLLTSFVIMMNTMLPLSLYVSLEIVKVTQMFMMNDIDMYDPVTDTPIEPHTSSLNEELGQVSYIFSDKTGTLTRNEMKFRKLSIAGYAFLHDHDLQSETTETGTVLKHKKRTKGKQKKQQHRRCESEAALMQNESTTAAGAEGYDTQARESLYTGKTDDLVAYIFRRPQSLFARKVRFFILALALCHTCIPEKNDDGEVKFQATSPDELALVTAAQQLGFIVTDRQTNTITMKIHPQCDSQEPTFETYKVLDVIEFSSDRKRMSIIVGLPDGRVCLFMKGADTTVRKLLAKAELAQMYAEDVHRRSEARKSIEAQAVIQRRSAQLNRTSMSTPPRASNIGRQSSVSLGRRPSARKSVDIWLREREGTSTVPRHSSLHSTPRVSQTAILRISAGRPSAGDHPRTSLQPEDLDDMIDESIVIDENAVFQRCFGHIDDFATEGLRTLIYGHRIIPEHEYRQWKELYHAASTSLVDRQKKVEQMAESIEQGLELTGATAIEDKLQVGVPDAIDRFRRAGIKMWMLTGDKRETAINIGHSCLLIKDYSTLMILDSEGHDLLTHTMAFVNDVQSGRLAHTVLVIDGQTLMVINADHTLKALFTDLAVATDSVICCRASPSQKAELVKTIRTKVKGSVTLAIGDGANDIAMIREAHLGIGIAGKEGLQAARTSDYSIGQFRFLLKLLLVHGRWNYVRICKYTLGTFWKETLFYIVQATYQRWNGYTGTSLYEPWSLSMFNTLFTSLPVVFMGAFEKDLAPATLLAVPELYSFGRDNRGFNMLEYARWALLGAVESQIVFFIMYGIYGEALFTRDNQIFAMGVLAFTACVTLISLKLQFFELHNKSITAAEAIFLSVGGWWLFNLIISQVYNSSEGIYFVKNGLTETFGKNPLWWLTLILIVLTVSAFELVLKAVKAIFFPNDVEIFQVLERDLEVKKRFEESAADLLQQGWDRGTKKSSVEIARETEEQDRREAEIQDILDRPRTMSPAAPGSASAPVMGLRKRQSWAPVDLEMIPTNQDVNFSTPPKDEEACSGRSIDVEELFTKGYGAVRKESMQ